jgi:hypothetical protein
VRNRIEPSLSKVLMVAVIGAFLPGRADGQGSHGQTNREAIDRMRDRDLEPERIMDVIDLREGMKAGGSGTRGLSMRSQVVLPPSLILKGGRGI